MNSLQVVGGVGADRLADQAGRFVFVSIGLPNRQRLRMKRIQLVLDLLDRLQTNQSKFPVQFHGLRVFDVLRQKFRTFAR